MGARGASGALPRACLHYCHPTHGPHDKSIENLPQSTTDSVFINDGRCVCHLAGEGLEAPLCNRFLEPNNWCSICNDFFGHRVTLTYIGIRGHRYPARYYAMQETALNRWRADGRRGPCPIYEFPLDEDRLEDMPARR